MMSICSKCKHCYIDQREAGWPGCLVETYHCVFNSADHTPGVNPVTGRPNQTTVDSEGTVHPWVKCSDKNKDGNCSDFFAGKPQKNNGGTIVFFVALIIFILVLINPFGF